MNHFGIAAIARSFVFLRNRIAGPEACPGAFAGTGGRLDAGPLAGTGDCVAAGSLASTGGRSAAGARVRSGVGTLARPRSTADAASSSGSSA